MLCKQYSVNMIKLVKLKTKTISIEKTLTVKFDKKESNNKRKSYSI